MQLCTETTKTLARPNFHKKNHRLTHHPRPLRERLREGVNTAATFLEKKRFENLQSLFFHSFIFHKKTSNCKQSTMATKRQRKMRHNDERKDRQAAITQGRRDKQIAEAQKKKEQKKRAEEKKKAQKEKKQSASPASPATTKKPAPPASKKKLVPPAEHGLSICHLF